MSKDEEKRLLEAAQNAVKERSKFVDDIEESVITNYQNALHAVAAFQNAFVEEWRSCGAWVGGMGTCHIDGLINDLAHVLGHEDIVEYVDSNRAFLLELREDARRDLTNKSE